MGCVFCKPPRLHSTAAKKTESSLTFGFTRFFPFVRSDNLRVKYLATIIAVTFKCLSALFLLIAWRLYKRHQDKYREMVQDEAFEGSNEEA